MQRAQLIPLASAVALVGCATSSQDGASAKSAFAEPSNMSGTRKESGTTTKSINAKKRSKDAKTTGDPAISRARRFERPGFAVYENDGRLWVFRDGAREHAGFLSTGEPAKRVTRVGAGPDRRTLIGADGDVLTAYAAAWKVLDDYAAASERK